MVDSKISREVKILEIRRVLIKCVCVWVFGQTCRHMSARLAHMSSKIQNLQWGSKVNFGCIWEMGFKRIGTHFCRSDVQKDLCTLMSASLDVHGSLCTSRLLS